MFRSRLWRGCRVTPCRGWTWITRALCSGTHLGTRPLPQLRWLSCRQAEGPRCDTSPATRSRRSRACTQTRSSQKVSESGFEQEQQQAAGCTSVSTSNIPLCSLGSLLCILHQCCEPLRVALLQLHQHVRCCCQLNEHHLNGRGQLRQVSDAHLGYVGQHLRQGCAGQHRRVRSIAMSCVSRPVLMH
jgi:hypothetical protein